MQPVSLALQQHVCKTDCKTKDSVMVKVMTAVQYKIERDMVKAAVFDIEQPLRQIEAEVDSILRSTVPSMTLDESYEAKDKMVEEILSSVKEAMKRYGYDIIKVRFRFFVCRSSCVLRSVVLEFNLLLYLQLL